MDILRESSNNHGPNKCMLFCSMVNSKYICPNWKFCDNYRKLRKWELDKIREIIEKQDSQWEI